MTAPASNNGIERSAATIIDALGCGKASCVCGKAARRKRGNVHCPAHDDQTPSLTVSQRGQTVLVHCKTGCPQLAVIGALREFGLWPTSPTAGPNMPRVTRYEYRNTHGQLVAVKQRTDIAPGRKKFLTLRPDGTVSANGDLSPAKVPLYRLPELLAADPSEPVLLVEGEKACDAARALGFVAVSLAGGASQTDFGDALGHLAGRSVVLIPDNDDPGRGLMERVAQLLEPIASTIGVVAIPDIPTKGDLADFTAAGHTADELRALIESAEPHSVAFQSPGTLSGGGKSEPDAEPGPGLVKRLADYIQETDYFTQDAGRELWVYRGGTYIPEGAEHVRRRVRLALESWKRTKFWSSRLANEVVEWLRVGSPHLWENPPADRVNLANGILDLATGELARHTPEFLSPIQIPVTFDPAAACPAWERFVGDVFPPDASDLAWEMAGDLLTTDRSIQTAFMLIGEGANGKSTWLRALTAFIGKRHVSAVPLQKLESDKFAAAGLIGKLANVAADIPATALAKTDVFKAIVGGDAVDAERKFKPAFQTTLYTRLIFSTNRAPRSPDGSDAFFRRWVVVPFTRTFKGTAAVDSKVLHARLTDPTELSGLLNKALAALDRLRERNAFTVSDSMVAAWTDFRTTTDPLSVWLDQNTISGDRYQVARTDLLRVFNASEATAGRAPYSETLFGRHLRALRPNIRPGQRGGRDGRVWVWLGIGLLTDRAIPGNMRDGSKASAGEAADTALDAHGAQSFTYLIARDSEEGATGGEGPEGLESLSRANPVHTMHEYPSEPCYACGGNAYWERPVSVGGGFVCATCHPPPPGGAP